MVDDTRKDVIDSYGRSHGIAEKEDNKWMASSKRQEMPPEQKATWEFTKKRVMQAASSVLGTTLDVTHEALILSTELLELAPVPGLQAIAKTLLSIWDSLEEVDMYRLQCLHLTERCAYILLSVRQEMQDAGCFVSEELKLPIQKLSESFQDVFNFLHKQSHRPFIQRYLKRDDIQREIAECHRSLHEALGMFSISIQVRILRQIQESDRRRGEETKAILDALGHTDAPLLHSDLNSNCERDSEPPIVLPSSGQPSSDTVLSSFDNIVAKQTSVDAAFDTAMLRKVLESALEAGSDIAMMETLGVERSEMAEAIETLQRALEQVGGNNARTSDSEVEGEPRALIPPQRALHRSLTRNIPSLLLPSKILKRRPIVPAQSSSLDEEAVVDRLDQEFLERGIGALRRMSENPEAALPTWAITKFEVDLACKIGMGFFSDVYRGTWRRRMVAIKILAPMTPRDLFVREVEIWRNLRHPNILELYGASSTKGDPPWLLVSPYMKEGSLVDFLRRAESVSKGLSNTPVVHASFGEGTRLLATVEGEQIQVPSMVELKGHDLLGFMHEIANGMAYLHSRGILHGDLKASNVLVTDQRHCVITDFGQSDMRSEVHRISGTPLPHGTLRWQAPELMSGVSHLTTEIDVYAFAICCVEILSMGRMPWHLADDLDVRHYVLNQDSRPLIPSSPFDIPGLHDLVHLCWRRDPSHRPAFSRIVRDINALKRTEDIRQDRILSCSGLPSLTIIPETPESSHPYPISVPPVTRHKHFARLYDMFLGGLNRKRDVVGIL